MGMIRCSMSLVFFLLFSAFLSLGQSSVKITKPELSYENEKLYISYDIIDKGKAAYHIELEAVNASHALIEASFLTGDIGTNIKAGNNKSIVWDIERDDVNLDESISIRLVATKMSAGFSKGKLLLQSAVWPGWGQTKMSDGKPYWLIGCAGVACLAGSYVYNQQSVKNYDQYLDALTVAEGDKYYDKAVMQDNTSSILGYSAIGIWAANLLWVALSPEKNSSGRKVNVAVYPLSRGNNYAAVSLFIDISN